MAVTRQIGAHVSAAGGPHLAVERAAAIGCNCLQLFSGSPRVWQKPALSIIEPEKIRTNQKKYAIKSIFTHALYLVNLATDNPESLAKSVRSLRYELLFDSRIGGAGVIVHVGSHQGRGFAAMKQQLVTAIAEILESTPADSTFLIENAASQKGKIGGTLEEIAELLVALEEMGAYVSGKRLGWCFDTCHAFAAGYVLTEVYGKIEALKLLNSLLCIHVNDSRDPFGSGRDRHENLGDGLIPGDELQTVLNQPELAAIPLILEVPGLEKSGPDAENVRRLKMLIGAE